MKAETFKRVPTPLPVVGHSLWDPTDTNNVSSWLQIRTNSILVREGTWLSE